ncbi:hypothetical protein ACN38_g11962 [Penicillium nordicum]|uniref:Uncharacterized protein n=1 Tax=Penicillium nordicum TaxID=229535 RepID=A0A0N0RXI9_9EURO|nr:hypothetical protein ACN38_g11962 [Penicillium nordicum]
MEKRIPHDMGRARGGESWLTSTYWFVLSFYLFSIFHCYSFLFLNNNQHCLIYLAFVFETIFIVSDKFPSLTHFSSWQ